MFVKKGDKVRCRHVAQECAGSDKREDLYAGTPLLSATRYLLSDSVSREASGNIKKGGTSLQSVTPGRRRSPRKLMLVDIKRAFLHWYCTRSIYIELLESESEGGKYVAKLIRALYGIRDAPLAWQTVVKKDMKELGFEECKVTNGVFTHAVRDQRKPLHTSMTSSCPENITT